MKSTVDGPQWGQADMLLDMQQDGRTHAAATGAQFVHLIVTRATDTWAVSVHSSAKAVTVKE
jgi:hypothetical protein